MKQTFYVALIGLLFPACMSFQEITDRTVFVKEVSDIQNTIPYYVFQEEWMAGVLSCEKLKTKKRTACIKKIVELANAKIDATYPNAPKEKCVEKFSANIDQQYQSNLARISQADTFFPNGRYSKELIGISAIVFYYEQVVRESEIDEKADVLYQNNVEQVNQYNNAAARQNAAALGLILQTTSDSIQATHSYPTYSSPPQPTAGPVLMNGSGMIPINPH